MDQIFNLSKEILGEVCGTFAGDGTLYATQRSYVLEVRGNRDEIDYYLKSVKPNFEKLFSKKLKIIKRYYKSSYVVGIRVCGKQVMEIFNKNLGFPVGKKSRIVEIPELIRNNPDYWKFYIRGLFDTDGSVYVKKSGKNGKYVQPIVDISSQSTKHLIQLKHIFIKLGFNPWIEKSGKIRMGGWSTTERFFKEIKPQNNKHIKRFERITKIRNAGVAETKEFWRQWLRQDK